MRSFLLGASALALVACGAEDTTSAPAPTPETDTEASAATDDSAVPSASDALDAVLEAQSDEAKARYVHRNPKETLEFFGVEPGMTVVDTLPGQPGWYGNILLPYLGSDGTLIGADYSMEMWPLFTNFATPEFLAERANWQDNYLTAASEVAGDNNATAKAFVYGSAPQELAGTADVILMIRAVHHFNRFEEGRFFTEALEESKMLLKPGGIVGVVAHRAPEGEDDAWANGDNGYMKQSQVVSVFENHGFELVEASEINANPNDQPVAGDFVWRLPPTLATSQDDPELRAEMEAIGETDRMTLKFKLAE